MRRAWNSTLPARREKPRRSPRTPEKGEGASVLHPGPFRSQALRDLAQECPKCMGCGKAKDGTIVGAHPNRMAYGKGMSQKAHDCPAYLCNDCHDLLDGRAGDLTEEAKDELFHRAAYKSWVWLMESGKLQVAA